MKNTMRKVIGWGVILHIIPAISVGIAANANEPLINGYLVGWGVNGCLAIFVAAIYTAAVLLIED